MIWLTILAASAGCYLIKLAGLSLPPRWVQGPRTSRVADLIPVALLAGLIALQTFTTRGGEVVVDARLAGVMVAVVAVLVRAPFLLVVILAASTTALLRALS